jgi:hypothetical protein
MTLPASAPISLTQVMDELRTVTPGRAYPIALGDADVRALAGVPSGPISLTNLLGKSAYVAMSGSIADVSATADSNPPSTYTESLPLSLTLAGGMAPFSYVWSKLSGDGAVTAINAASTTANFTNARFSPPGQVQSQVVQCVVTDNTGATLTRTATATLTLI